MKNLHCSVKLSIEVYVELLSHMDRWCADSPSKCFPLFSSCQLLLQNRTTDLNAKFLLASQTAEWVRWRAERDPTPFIHPRLRLCTRRVLACFYIPHKEGIRRMTRTKSSEGQRSGWGPTFEVCLPKILNLLAKLVSIKTYDDQSWSLP